jgi:aspartokinase-like uncharacterized kinase
MREDVLVEALILPDTSSIIKILAGTSALPVPGGGLFASTVNARINSKELSNKFSFFIANLLAIIALLLWQISQILADICAIE